MRAFIIVAVSCCFLVTAATGTAFLLTPIKASEPNPWVYVAPLASIQNDGVPHRYALKAVRRDAWTRLEEQRLGVVFIRRISGPSKVLAFRQTPFGAWLRYDEEKNIFTEGCWGMRYDINGKCLNPNNPGYLRPLAVKVDGDNVLVNPEWQPGPPD